MANWKFNIGDVIKDNCRNLIITDREIRFMSTWKKPCNEKWVKYTCNNCGWTEGWSPEKSIIEGKGCPCCCGQVVVKGINDLATTASYVIPFLLNLEDAYKYTSKSQAFIKTKCPFCGEIRDYKIAQLTISPYVCRKCGKNTSIPEKFFEEFLKMYHIDFIPQLSSAKMKWCGKYRYDFYLPTFQAIVEIHGQQHYQKGIYNRTYEEIHEIDNKKQQLALDNGIKNYYIVPAIRSEKNKLIEAIANHEIIDMLKIDRKNLKQNLEKCYVNILGKRTLSICQYYTIHPNYSVAKIAEHFNISTPTVLHALWNGTEIGICKYDGQAKLKETLNKIKEKRSKGVEIIKPNGESIKFASIKECNRESSKIFGHEITRWFIKKFCNTEELYENYQFKYVH